MGRTFRVLATGLACLWLIGVTSSKVAGTVDEAPAGFDNQTNGFVDQTAFDGARVTFEERDDIDKGLGPVYNTQSCAECHQNPVTGGISQVTELRAGHFNGTSFVNPPGGSLINDRAVSAEIQERVPDGFEVRTFRTSLNTLGDGFVEAIDDQTLKDIAANQPAGMRGLAIDVPVFETGGTRVGRFGWKNQMGSLLSFASDAYLNEQGITNRFNLVENTSLGLFVGFGNPNNYDHVPDNQACNHIANTICGEDQDDDISAFATFMRATKAPSRGAITPSVTAGEVVFNTIGCSTCHVGSIMTAASLPPHMLLGDAVIDPTKLEGKTIHPFGDFLLHNIGTGDGIVQNGGPDTRNRMRTAPLWGVRTRDRLMHDGLSLTFEEAIFRHGGEALGPTLRFVLQLNNTQRNNLIAFLKSL